MRQPRIGWGVLGAGGIAAAVAADIAAGPGSRLVAVAARDPRRAATFAERHGFERSHASYDALVQDPDVDVVYVATTNAQHRDHALLALRSGKPVLVEKPFALNAAQAREVVAAADAAGLFCMEAMWMRFQPLIRRAQDFVASGQIGAVVGMRADLSYPIAFDAGHRVYDLELGGGVLLDLGIYPAHLCWLLMGRPLQVVASGSLTPTGTDDTAAMQWTYPDGRYAQLSSSFRADNPSGALVVGTHGWVELPHPLQYPPSLTLHSRGIRTRLDQVVAGNGYGPQIAEVERCLAGGWQQSPTATLADTVSILEVLDNARAQIGVRYAADRDRLKDQPARAVPARSRGPVR